MRLILTHENADFDAVAAQLAAHKLDSAAIPVLPRRINNNVQEFINLYRSVLPHVTVADLPRGTVESVTVVDTQSVVTVKGMRPQTPAYIIDHHPLAGPLPDHQTLVGDPLGATTTLLIEQIQETPLTLTPIEATLLTLGIYEDTGSLLYGTTTARDIAAAAWLVERGADLDVVRRFLQHPLNDDQQMLYNLLLKHTTVHEIQGHPVAVAAASVPDNVDQVSTVAHKLRDTLEPSALFMLVQMGTRIQIVARSTVDEINVGLVADYLGGGGHRRAAAALIEDADLTTVQELLLARLRDVVEPVVAVGDIMSVGNVRTVTVHTPIHSIAAEMQRSGHEGYPVVQDGELVGLITRNAVDRAIAHGMGSQPVGRIMESGRVAVRPSDSLHFLQQQMMRSGWGQIPVVNEAGDLLGIVTRTDLINQWGQPENGASRREEMLLRLERVLSPGLLALVQAVSEQAQAMNLGLYSVGGFVRDLLLARPNTDIDLVVEGDAIALVQALMRQYGGTMRKHLQFGTATWLLDETVVARFGAAPDWPETLDFVTARAEFYENPTALPTVMQSSIKLDLHRRDFTINTLALRLSPDPFGQLLDFWGGERDLEHGVIRVLHSLSFIDDPTRILRAARFEQRFNFNIEARTLGLIERALPLLDRVTGPRLRHELELMLIEARPEQALRRLQTVGVLAYLSADLQVDEWLAAVFAALRQVRQLPPWPGAADELANRDRWMLILFAVWCARLAEEEAERLGRRLQVKRKTLNEVIDATQTYHKRLPLLAEAQRPSEIVWALDGLSEMGLLAAWVIAPTYELRDKITAYVMQWQAIRPMITGEDLTRLGLEPGPLYGRLLHRVRNAWLDGEVTTSEAEHALIVQLLAEGWGADDGIDG